MLSFLLQLQAWVSTTPRYAALCSCCHRDDSGSARRPDTLRRVLLRRQRRRHRKLGLDGEVVGSSDPL